MPPTSEISTAPSGLRIVYYDKSHRYKIGMTADGLLFVPSVSTVLDKALPKNLTGWAERLTVAGIVSLEQLGRSPLRLGPDAILKELHAKGLRYYQQRDNAAARGTLVHRAFESLCNGRVPFLADFEPEHRGYVQGIAKWWTTYNPEVLYAELMVGSLKHGFAGRMDLLCVIRWKGRTIVCVIDLKTSKAIRDSHHFQTAGYLLGALESGYPEAEKGFVLRVGADGEYEFVESWATGDQFLALVESMKAQKQFEVEGKRRARELAA